MSPILLDVIGTCSLACYSFAVRVLVLLSFESLVSLARRDFQAAVLMGEPMYPELLLVTTFIKPCARPVGLYGDLFAHLIILFMKADGYMRPAA